MGATEQRPAHAVSAARVLHRSFRGQLLSVPKVRRWAREAVQTLGADDETADDAALVVCELVTNAIRHAGVAQGVSVALHRWRQTGVRVEVADDGPGRPLLSPLDAMAESGRGLRLVDSLAHSWGWSPRVLGPGKVVYACLGPEGGTEDLFPLPEPVPVDSCPDCAALAGERVAARGVGDRSAAADVNVLMRKHQGEMH
jgi:anti-sigma regulatory factor (Ser/Thr protein kinase)